MLLRGAVLAAVLLIAMLAMPIDSAVASPAGPSSSADVFDYPLASWTPHCLGFSSQWRYCNGAPLRECANGVVWLHTGVDEVATAGEPVLAAGDGVIAGYLIDPVFRGGVLIRHQTSSGVVITQYWHVWLRPGFSPESRVTRGQAFAEVADMGDLTHLHFAVFMGDYESHAWNGALPPSACSGFPAFPYRFVDPNAFLAAHAAPTGPLRIFIRHIEYE